VAQSGTYLKGTTAETKGPGANKPADNGKRIEEGRYSLWTQEPGRYATWDYSGSQSVSASPRPGIELKGTGERYEILVHPGLNTFLSSVGCINLCTHLPNANERITYVTSRKRVIALIEDMKSYLREDFPKRNGKRSPRSFAGIDGEP